MYNILQPILAIVLSVVSLFVSLGSALYLARRRNRLPGQARLAVLLDRLCELTAKCRGGGEGGLKPEAEHTPLKMEHRLFDIDQMTDAQPLTQPQNRLVADAFERLLFFDYAQKYWDKVFGEPFDNSEIEAEYYRNYAHFLYRRGDFAGGEAAINKALALPCDSDNKLFSKFLTYTDWALMEYKREVDAYNLDVRRGLDAPFPKLELAYGILGRAKPLLESFGNYGFYENSVKLYNDALRKIEIVRDADARPRKARRVEK